ncbi:hypothetical protein ACTFIY_005878 [Dictyostelium cf. discoideum]
MIGEGVVQNAIESDEVEKILIVGRRESGFKNEKVKEILHNNFLDLTNIQNEFIGYNSVYFCAGVSSVGLNRETYEKLTVDMPMEMLRKFELVNNIKSKDDNDCTFIYITSALTNSDSWLMWSQVKAKAENQIISSNFNKTFAFRPAWIQPNIPGLKNANKTYKYISWMYPIGRSITQNGFVTLGELSRAMINASTNGYKSNIIHGTYEEIRNWAITKNSNAINDALTKEVNQILSTMDKYNDGNLTAGEMLDYFVKQGLKLNDACEMIKTYFEQVGKDSDGILTVCELKKFIGADLQVPSQ